MKKEDKVCPECGSANVLTEQHLEMEYYPSKHVVVTEQIIECLDCRWGKKFTID
jgi:uncharacterized protein with PIN domain